MTPILIYGSLYAAGIILGGWITPQPVVFLGCAAVALALVTGLAAWCSRLRVASWLAVPLALATGAVTYAAAMAPGEWDPTHLPVGTEVALHGTLMRDLVLGPYQTRTVLRVWAGKVGDEILPLSGVAAVDAVRPPDEDTLDRELPQPLRRTVPRAGDEVVVVGRMAPLRSADRGGGFDEARYYGHRYGAFSRVRHAAVIEVPRAGLPSRGDLRHMIIRRSRELCPPYRDGLTADVMLSMVFGSASLQLPDAIMDAFRRAGTVHVLVVSGAQVATLAGLAAWLSGWLRLSRGWGLCLPILAAPAYTFLVPDDGSILRALAFLGVLFAGRALYRDPDTARSMAAAVFGLLLVWPTRLYDLSLQLSVLAVTGTIYGVRLLGPRWAPQWRRRPLARASKGIWAGFAASVGASLATCPLIARVYGTVSLAAPFANLLAIPIAGILMALMFVSTPLAWVMPPLARGLNSAGGLLAEGLIWVTEAVGWPYVEGSRWPAWLVVLAYLALGALVSWGEAYRRGRLRRGTEPEERSPCEPNEAEP